MARDSVRELGMPALTSDIPLRRLATVEDVAGVALFLASPAADYLTGTIIPVAVQYGYMVIYLYEDHGSAVG